MLLGVFFGFRHSLLFGMEGGFVGGGLEEWSGVDNGGWTEPRGARGGSGRMSPNAACRCSLQQPLTTPPPWHVQWLERHQNCPVCRARHKSEVLRYGNGDTPLAMNLY